MGIKGLQNFVNKQKLLHDFSLVRGSELVVDGACLLRSIHQGNTVRYGGEYAIFMRECECFFNNMKSIGITMCIVFDGGIDESKYKIIIERHQRKLNLLWKLSKGEDKKNFSLAVFTMECFMVVARKFKDTVEIRTAPYEADPEIARLAEEKGCLVLSSDYDMLIYNLTHGFLPIHEFDISTLRKQPVFTDQLQCKRVFARDLARALQIDTGDLPLFAALRMHTTDSWDGFEETAKQVRDKPAEIRRLGKQIRDTRKAFKLQGSKQHVQTSPSKDAVCLDERVQMLIDNGNIFHGALGVWERREFIPVKQVEDFTKPSSNHVSRNIRSFWYSIICAGDTVRPIVKEHSRKPEKEGNRYLRIARFKVNLIHEVVCKDGNIISLSKPESLTKSEKRRILMVALEAEITEDQLGRFEDDLKLLWLVTRFWIRKARPSDYIKEALVSILSGNAVSRQQDISTGREDMPFLLDVAHAYAQWQSCLVSAHDLNLILGSPLSEFRKENLPNGSDLHCLANALKTGNCVPTSESKILMASFLELNPSAPRSHSG